MLELLASANPADLWMGSTVVYFALYTAIGPLLLYKPQFARLRPDLQLYIVSNLVKAIVLGMSGVMLWELVIDIIWLDKWDAGLLRALAPIYAGLDLVSLVLLHDRLGWSTFFHHVFVVLFAAVISFTDSVERGLHRSFQVDTGIVLGTDKGRVLGAMCLYGLFSMLAYFVNGFLALRFLITPSAGNARFNDAVARVCAALYAVICAVHWWTQIALACEHGYVRWLALFIPFVYDDLLLMHKLSIYRSPTAAPRKSADPAPDDPELASDAPPADAPPAVASAG